MQKPKNTGPCLATDGSHKLPCAFPKYCATITFYFFGAFCISNVFAVICFFGGFLISSSVLINASTKDVSFMFKVTSICFVV